MSIYYWTKVLIRAAFMLGKTTLCNAIKSLLDHESLRVAILSLDGTWLNGSLTTVIITASQ